MRLARPARRTPPESIIPLIDVVFFLLVFFMLIGRMDATAPFEVTPATAMSGTDMPGGGVTLSVSASGDLALDGTALTAPAVLQQTAQLVANAPATLIRINAHRDAELAFVLPLVAQIEAQGAQKIVLVVTPDAP
jgi:biopolymer transport protein ExbD